MGDRQQRARRVWRIATAAMVAAEVAAIVALVVLAGRVTAPWQELVLAGVFLAVLFGAPVVIQRLAVRALSRRDRAP